MRVLLANAYFYRLDPKQWRDARPYPPLATIQAAAYLRGDHEVKVFDTCLRHSPEELVDAIREFGPDVLAIHDDGFNYLTKMCLTVMREACFRMITIGKEQGCRVVVNSSDSTDHFPDYLAKGADAVIMGEGEATLQELMDLWKDGGHMHEPVILNQSSSVGSFRVRSVRDLKDPSSQSLLRMTDRLEPGSLSSIPGLAFMHNGVAQRTAARPVFRNLDQLPIPAWDLVDPAPYKAIWEGSQGFFSLNVATTRGCPFKCNWCAKPIYGNRYNSRSPAHVADEIAWLYAHHRPEHIWFCDDIFGLKPGWVQAFGAELRLRGIRIPFKIQSRVDLLLESDTIDALAAAGLQEVWVGAESGSQKILDAMDKGTTVQQIGKATRLLHEKGIRVGFFLQFGYLGETDEDIDATLHMLEELQPDDIGISVSYPLPGTKFHEMVKDQLGPKANWSDSDDLAMMFRNTHRPAFYKRLHRYVHKRFRRRQALTEWQSIVHAPLGKPHDLRRAASAAYYLPAAVIDRFRLERLRA
ncbi:MAG: radical SAM protein [Flavobacteriales bacterium]